MYKQHLTHAKRDRVLKSDLYLTSRFVFPRGVPVNVVTEDEAAVGIEMEVSACRWSRFYFGEKLLCERRLLTFPRQLLPE